MDMSDREELEKLRRENEQLRELIAEFMANVESAHGDFKRHLRRAADLYVDITEQPSPVHPY